MKIQCNRKSLLVLLLSVCGVLLCGVYFAQNLETLNHTLLEETLVERVGDTADGPGNGGAAYVIPENHSMKSYEGQLSEIHSYNLLVSMALSVNRSLGDQRPANCLQKSYAKSQPASVVIVVHNEFWKTLVRTINSVLNRTPGHLLKEIIIVNDASTHTDLNQKLQEWIKKWPSIVRLIELDAREGLIYAKLQGAKAATSNHLVFIEAHCEVTTGWIEPLLDVLEKSRSTVPLIHTKGINPRNFEFSKTRGINDGGMNFKVDFYYVPFGLAKVEKIKETEDPYQALFMQGGLFAINRDFFFEIGAYDPGMKIWGVENVDLSSRIWMCGGRIVYVPCSIVGHIYRQNKIPWSWNGINVYGRNVRRFADVWLDEYKLVAYMYSPSMLDINPGDLTERKQQRKKCKSFSWFLKNVWTESPFTINVNTSGALVSDLNNLCATLHSKETAGDYVMKMEKCHNVGNNQFVATRANSKQMMVQGTHEIRCVSLESGGDTDYLRFKYCNPGNAMQKWEYDWTTRQFIQEQASKCLTSGSEGSELNVGPCDVSLESQKWTIRHHPRLTGLIDTWIH